MRLLCLTLLLLALWAAPVSADHCPTGNNIPDRVINSPNYPGEYANFSDNTWTITASVGQSIRVEFAFFELESCASSLSMYCPYDWVSLHDGNGDQGKLCGGGCPVNQVFNTHIISLDFHSDYSITCRGFEVHFFYINADACASTPCLNGGTCSPDGEIFTCQCADGWLGIDCGMEACPVSVDNYDDIISSPNFPYDYGNGYFNITTVTAPADKIIRVEFSAFALEYCYADVYTGCSYDWVRLYDATDTDTYGPLCGRGCPHSYIFHSNIVSLEFNTDGSVVCTGFVALFFFIDPVDPCELDPCHNSGTCIDDGTTYTCQCAHDWLGLTCEREACPHSGDLQQETIESPNFLHGEYGNNYEHTWTVTAPADKDIMVEFVFFALESCYSTIYTGCSFDWVRLYHAGYDTGRFCGRGCPGNHTFYSNNVFLEFHTDSSVVCEGFVAHFHFVNRVPPCDFEPCLNGGTCTGDETTYTCHCAHDWLGLNCERHACPHSGDLQQETIVSPNFLHGEYGNNYDNTWNVTAPAGEVIRVEFVFFTLEYCGSDIYTNCIYDWVRLYNDDYDSGKLCGQGCPGSYIFHTNSVILEFRTDGSVVCDGFEVHFFFIQPVDPCESTPCLNGGTCTDGVTTFICQCASGWQGTDCGIAGPCASSPCRNGGTCTDDETTYTCQCADGWQGIECGIEVCPGSGSGATPDEIISSPNFPGPYHHSLDRIWNFTAPQDYTIRVEFPFFSVEIIFESSCLNAIQHSCSYDWVEVYGDDDFGSGKICGMGCPGPIVLNTNIVFIEFNVDSIDHCQGFVAHIFFVPPVLTGSTCHIKGDPHVTDFPASFHASLPFSCLYLASRATFDVTGGATVDVQVIASNGLRTRSGRYFVDYVMVVIEDTAGSFRVTYQSDISVMSSMTNEGQSAWIIDGTALPGYVDVFMDFNAAEDAAYLMVGSQSGFIVQVKFFPRIRHHHHLRHRGLEITVSDTATYVYPFPSTVCDELSGGRGTSAILGPFSDDTKLLLAVLQQGLPQSNNMCQAVVATYDACDSTKAVAVAQCQQYLQRDKSRCLYDSSEEDQARQSFLSCLQHMCGIQDNYNCDGDHCEMGTNCQDDDCHALSGLVCSSDDDCIDGTTCDSSICKIQASEGENCQFCHRVCGGGNAFCDSNFVCSVQVPGLPCVNSQCAGNLVCEEGICKLTVTSQGCDSDHHCVGDSICDGNTCLIPYGNDCAGFEQYCQYGGICDVGICACPVTRTSPNFEYTSPHYPDVYENNWDHTETVAAPAGYTIDVEMVFFSLEGSVTCLGGSSALRWNYDCSYDWIYLSNLGDATSVGPVCGAGCFDNIFHFDSNIVHLRFKTDHRDLCKGFKAWFFFNPPAAS